MLGGVPPSRWVTQLAGLGVPLPLASFLHAKAAEFGNQPDWGNQITCHEHFELFHQFHLQNCQNADEIASAVDNLRVDSDRLISGIRLNFCLQRRH